MSPRILLRTAISTTPACPRCRLRSIINLKRQARLQSTSSGHSQPKWTLLTNRKLIRLSGPDAANFLHNIIPAKILGVGTAPIYTAFLAAQGRILQDVFIYPPSWEGEKKHEWLIDVDAESASDLYKHLRRHKLRSKFAIELVASEEAGIWCQWPSSSQSSTKSWIKDGVRAGGPDPRPQMGLRVVLNQDSNEGVRTSLGAEEPIEASLEEYTVHRMLMGLAEGQKEIISGHGLPQESNLDFLGGIDFHKGCYLGQELTIRTHHTGVVRKRILPCQIYDEEHPVDTAQAGPSFIPETWLDLPPSGSNISKISTRKGRSTGKWLGGVGNVGLALCRLEMMTDIQLTADSTNFDPTEEYRVQWGGGEDGEAKEVRIKPFIPPWVTQGIEQSLKRKEKKPQKKTDEDEEDID